MTMSKKILDELLQGVERPKGLLGDAGLMKERKIKLIEQMLGAELTAHLKRFDFNLRHQIKAKRPRQMTVAQRFTINCD